LACAIPARATSGTTRVALFVAVTVSRLRGLVMMHPLGQAFDRLVSGWIRADGWRYALDMPTTMRFGIVGPSTVRKTAYVVPPARLPNPLCEAAQRPDRIRS